jgi:hypothetical protein
MSTERVHGPDTVGSQARRERLVARCLALPEATSRQDGRHTTFLVRGRTFAYHLDDHHGDGLVALCCKVGPGENDLLVRMDPERYYLPAYIGPRGWVALRLDLATVDWDEVEGLVQRSYRLVAPKRLADRQRGG